MSGTEGGVRRGPGAVWGRLAGASLRPGEASAASVLEAEAESAEVRRRNSL